MDCVTMMLIEGKTKIPLDLVIFINSFLPKRLTDENFKQAIALWFQNKEECKWRYGHISFWNTSRVTNMGWAFYYRVDFNEDISRWNVSQVTNMSSMFNGATGFNGDLSQWNVSKVSNMGYMFFGASQFNGDISQWDISNVTNLSFMFEGAIAYQGERWIGR
jgi:surface protein